MEMEEMLALYQGMSMIGSLVSFAIAVFSIVCMWKVFAKAGEGGWKILIPIYNEYIRFKIAGCKARYWLSFVLSAVSIGLMVYSAGDIFNDLYLVGTLAYLPDSTILCMLAAVLLLVVVGIIGITVNFKMAKAFNLPGVFGLGLWLLPVIFYAVIAFNGNIVHQNAARVETAYETV